MVEHIWENTHRERSGETPRSAAPTEPTAPTAEPADPFLASLLPEDPRSRSRVLSALMRALLAERRLPS